MRKSVRALSVITVLAAVLAVGASALAATTKGKADKGTSYVAVVRQAGGFDYTAGISSDKLFGPGAVTYKLKIVSAGKTGTFKITAKPVVLFTSTGSLTGTGSATLTVGAKGAATITDGKLKLTKGTGGQKGHSFAGTFTGTGSAITGNYTFQYKGTYK